MHHPEPRVGGRLQRGDLLAHPCCRRARFVGSGLAAHARPMALTRKAPTRGEGARRLALQGVNSRAECVEHRRRGEAKLRAERVGERRGEQPEGSDESDVARGSAC